jgi:hypothetical protein
LRCTGDPGKVPVSVKHEIRVPDPKSTGERAHTTGTKEPRRTHTHTHSRTRSYRHAHTHDAHCFFEAVLKTRAELLAAACRACAYAFSQLSVTPLACSQQKKRLCNAPSPVIEFPRPQTAPPQSNKYKLKCVCVCVCVCVYDSKEPTQVGDRSSDARHRPTARSGTSIFCVYLVVWVY